MQQATGNVPLSGGFNGTSTAMHAHANMAPQQALVLFG